MYNKPHHHYFKEISLRREGSSSYLEVTSTSGHVTDNSLGPDITDQSKEFTILSSFRPWDVTLFHGNLILRIPKGIDIVLWGKDTN